MTVVASITARDVVLVLAACRDAVMTGATRSGYLGMVDDVHGRKYVRVVAVLAYVGRRYVGRVFAARIRTVMAAPTVADDIDVIEISRCPACRGMAIVTVVAAVHMRRVLAGGRNTVVTGTACADDLCVIDGKCGSKDIGRMAVLTDIGRLDMRQVLTFGFGAIVAIEAAARDVDVVEVRGQPANRRVTVITIIAAGYVCRVLANCRDAVMAGATGSYHLCVINRSGRLKSSRAVAVFADVCCLHVRRTFAGCCGSVMAAHTVSDDACVIKHGR